MAERFDYIPVENVEKGQTLINLGIVEQIYIKGKKVHIVFNPHKSIINVAMEYEKGARLMVA